MNSCRLFLAPVVACLLVGAFSGKVQAQNETPVIVRGKISDPEKKIVLYPATIRNKNTGARVFSDQGGYYRIGARKGDEILISFIGYVPDSCHVGRVMGEGVQDARLMQKERFLPSVEVSGKWNRYQLDSLARYEEFKPFLETKSHTLVNTEKKTTPGFGLTFSPFTSYSKKQTDLKKFKKLYVEYERQAYIDYRYSKAFVARVTGLSGDSLLQFVGKYTPGYEMLRNMNNETLIMWTSVRAVQWRRDPKVTMKPEE